jgi:hypothetical protein
VAAPATASASAAAANTRCVNSTPLSAVPRAEPRRQSMTAAEEYSKK